MGLQILRARRAVPEHPEIPDHPRGIAIEWLRGKIADGRAGLDPYDRTLLILDAGANERVWAYRSLDLVGLILHRAPRGQGERFKTLLHIDAKLALGLARDDAPVMADEPLASRAVDSPLEALVDAVWPQQPERRPDFQPEAPAALARALAAYERQVH